MMNLVMYVSAFVRQIGTRIATLPASQPYWRSSRC